MPQLKRAEDMLTSAAADVLIGRATVEAVARGLALCFAVTDGAGQLLAFRRMDGAGRISIDVAIGKARTAALFGKPVQPFETMIDGGKTSMLSVPGAVLIGGGVPVSDGKTCLGALGVSGATGETDDEIARSVVAAFEGDLA